ncbi:hypothetical protein NDI37_03215 [Funiculus sociatus GB2-A5]|uniref:Uncharacterized protein n=1 Tax=Funiculus sociatus GB2-A5 TaxID=2933946 RepID=A0ABV0JJ67_9CYAN|nr:MULTISPECIES: hypothetical protein [unclassified Trichocoleus]MBD1908643.1 hypothetical protein [Trichocoleus sp. FACHB-832]MBD2063265.1 hypothetical protein [Trichocoleus sp. FACHB-6]
MQNLIKYIVVTPVGRPGWTGVKLVRKHLPTLKAKYTELPEAKVWD